MITADEMGIINKRKIKRLLEIAVAHSGGSQQDLAQVLGISQESISRYISGKREAPHEVVYAAGRLLGWSEEKVKAFVVDGYGRPDPEVWKSPDRLQQELSRLDVNVLAQINESVARLINQKICAIPNPSDKVVAYLGEEKVIELDQTEWERLSELVQVTAIEQSEDPENFLVNLGIQGILAQELLIPQNRGWRLPEPLFDILSQNLYRPKHWRINRPILTIPRSFFRDGVELKISLKSGNGAIK